MKHVSVSFILLAALAALPSAAHAQSAIIGYGMETCAEVTKQLSAGPAQQDAVVSWVNGWVSGLNSGVLTLHQNYHDVAGLSKSAVLGGIYSACSGRENEVLIQALDEYRYYQKLPVAVTYGQE